MDTNNHTGNVYRLTPEMTKFIPKNRKDILLIIPLKHWKVRLNENAIAIQLGDILRIDNQNHFSMTLSQEEVPQNKTTAYIFELPTAFFEDKVWGQAFLADGDPLLRTSEPTIINFIGLIESALREKSEDKLYSQEMIHHYLEIICIQISRLKERVYYPELTAKLAEDGVLFEAINHYIQSHFDEDLSNKELSKLFYISEKKLITLFKEFSNVTPQKFITSKRLTVAEALIMEGQSITQAASQVGYKNYSTFYRQFLAEFGVSPDKYFKEYNAN